MPTLKHILEMLHKAEYAEVFALLDQAKVMKNLLHTLKHEFEVEGIKAFFAQRLEVAIKEAFNAPRTSSELLPVPLPPDHFMGRQDELEKLHTNLTAGKRTLLVNGMGGIGKTALAQKYAQAHQADYAHTLWIRQSGDLMTSFVQTELLDALRIDYKEQTDRQVLFAEVLKVLRDLSPTNLLIIDNYEPTEIDTAQKTLKTLFALPAHWRVLCTSRVDVPAFAKTINLSVLPPKEAIALFKQHATGKPIEDAEVDALLNMIGYHTLMTELLAKTYRETMHFESVGALHAFIQKEALAHQKLQEDIYMDTEETRMYPYLKTVFSLVGLSEDELWLLKQWVVLPTTPHKGTDFLTWIQDTDLAYEKPLKALAKKGWLQTNGYLYYALHPFLQLFLHQELKPTLPDCEKMWKYFTDLTDLENAKANPLAHQWTIAIGEAMMQYIAFANYKIKQGILWNRICSIYMLLGNYPNAIRCAKEYVVITEATVDKQHEDYATALNNLALLYNNQGNYAEALPLHQEALHIQKEVLGKRHPDYAQSLNNLALLYDNQGNYTEALPLFQESLQIRKEVLGEQHPDYARALNNLAVLYYKQGNYTEALPLYQKALQIRKSVLEERHPDYAISLWCIGVLYFKQGNYPQAKTYLTEAYDIFLEKLGEQHPYTQKTKGGLNDLPDGV